MIIKNKVFIIKNDFSHYTGLKKGSYKLTILSLIIQVL